MRRLLMAVKLFLMAGGIAVTIGTLVVILVQRVEVIQHVFAFEHA